MVKYKLINSRGKSLFADETYSSIKKALYNRELAIEGALIGKNPRRAKSYSKYFTRRII